MTKHLTRTDFDVLEHAIQTVINDSRVPKTLRTALGVYQDRRAALNNRETAMIRAGKTEPACPPETIRSDLTFIEILRNDESFDWSVEINGQRHCHVPSEVMEALVECAVIVAQTSSMRAFSHRPQ
jgi:hypothetical protein